MFTAVLLVALAIAYIVLKTLNMRARFAEEDARRQAEEQKAKAMAEEEAEEEAVPEDIALLTEIRDLLKEKK